MRRRQDLRSWSYWEDPSIRSRAGHFRRSRCRLIRLTPNGPARRTDRGIAGRGKGGVYAALLSGAGESAPRETVSPAGDGVAAHVGRGARGAGISLLWRMQYHGTCPPISSKQTNDPEGARHQIRCGRARARWSVQLTSGSLSSRPRNRRVCTIVTHLTLTCLRLSDNMTPSLIALFIRGPRRTFTP